MKLPPLPRPKPSPEWVEALWQLSKERGGGYVPNEEIAERAKTIVLKPRIVLPPVPRPLPPIPTPTTKTGVTS